MVTPIMVAVQVSMLWNWDTVDACFLSSTWHIRTTGESHPLMLVQPETVTHASLLLNEQHNTPVPSLASFAVSLWL